METSRSSLGAYRPQFEDLPLHDQNIFGMYRPGVREVMMASALDQREDKKLKKKWRRIRMFINWRRRHNRLVEQRTFIFRP